METPEFLPPDGREGRRFRGLHLKQQGWSRHEIAEGLGISPVSVSHWFARVRDGGPEALALTPVPDTRPNSLPLKSV